LRISQKKSRTPKLDECRTKRSVSLNDALQIGRRCSYDRISLGGPKIQRHTHSPNASTRDADDRCRRTARGGPRRRVVALRTRPIPVLKRIISRR
jgi:hypothetical protein